ncbi:MAG: RNA degradosome polyphosphate kinase, partial [Ruminiclostridium sp.]
MFNNANARNSTSSAFKQNRDLSWLKFNERVLEEAEDKTVPLWERLKFLAIFTSNLDEFFMIRVGSLFDMSIFNPAQIDNKSGMTSKEQLHKIYKQVDQLNDKRDQLFYEIESQLRLNGIYSLDYNELEVDEKKYIDKYYQDIICPILSPQIVDPLHPFPHLHNKVIHISALLKTKGEIILGIIPIPTNLPDIVFLPGDDIRYI